MEQLLYKITGFVEITGVANTAVLTAIILLFIFSLVYLAIVIDSYSSLGSIKKIVSFGKYNVEMKFDSGTKKTMIVNAWNKVNAVERVAKKINTLDGVTFISKKVTE